MWEFLVINKVLQTTHGELANIVSKLTEINECIKNNKELKEIEDDTTFSNEQRHLYKDRKLGGWTTSKAWVTFIPQHKKISTQLLCNRP